jgi:hypothetical protein
MEKSLENNVTCFLRIGNQNPSSHTGVLADPLGQRAQMVIMPHGVEAGGGTVG